MPRFHQALPQIHPVPPGLALVFQGCHRRSLAAQPERLISHRIKTSYNVLPQVLPLLRFHVPVQLPKKIPLHTDILRNYSINEGFLPFRRQSQNLTPYPVQYICSLSHNIIYLTSQRSGSLPLPPSYCLTFHIQQT